MGRTKGWIVSMMSWVLLVAYALFILKPVVPVIVDKLAHTFWLNFHVAVVHVENGKEHVHYELSRMAKDFGNDKSGGKVKQETESTPHLVTATTVLNLGQTLQPLKVRHAVFASAVLPGEVAYNGPPPKA